MPATYAAPTAFAETKGSNSGLPPEWMLMRGNLTRALIDMMNPLEGGYFDETPVEFAGLQTDTTRYGVVSGVGMEQAMASAGSEVSAITASTQTTTYNSLAIAEYVISYTETYRNQILMGGNANGVNLTLEELEAMVLKTTAPPCGILSWPAVPLSATTLSAVPRCTTAPMTYLTSRPRSPTRSEPGSWAPPASRSGRRNTIPLWSLSGRSPFCSARTCSSA